MPSSYPFDPSGNNTSNLIVNEQNILNANQYLNYYIVIPRFAPFFTNNIVVKFQDQNGNVTTLSKGTDYDLALPYIGATRGLGLPVFGAFVFYNLSLNGTVSLTYQTVGGDWIADPNYVLGVLAEKAYNPRTVIWDVLTNVPSCFPPLVHYQPYDDIQGQSEVVNAILAIRDAIANKGNPLGDLAPHINNYNNPHQVTANQVNLGNVSNLPLASDIEVLTAEKVEKYITLRQLNIICNRVLFANKVITINPYTANNYITDAVNIIASMIVTLKQFYVTNQLNWNIRVIQGNINQIDPTTRSGVTDYVTNDLGETRYGTINIKFTSKTPEINFVIEIRAPNNNLLFTSGYYNYSYTDFLLALEYGACGY